jgi:hypothetical protein
VLHAQPIISSTPLQGVSAGRGVSDGVLAIAAVEQVISAAATQRVRAAIAGKGVIAGSTGQKVGAGATVDDIIADTPE